MSMITLGPGSNWNIMDKTCALKLDIYVRYFLVQLIKSNLLLWSSKSTSVHNFQGLLCTTISLQHSNAGFHHFAVHNLKNAYNKIMILSHLTLKELFSQSLLFLNAHDVIINAMMDSYGLGNFVINCTLNFHIFFSGITRYCVWDCHFVAHQKLKL